MNIENVFYLISKQKEICKSEKRKGKILAERLLEEN